MKTVPEIKFDPTKLKLVNPKTLKRDPNNRNKHSKEQIDRFCELLLNYGMRWPIIVSEQTGLIKAGEGRLLAALQLKMPQVLVSYQEFESHDLEYGFGVSDNAIASWAVLDLSAINMDIVDLGPDFDINLLGIEDFKVDPSEKEGGKNDDVFESNYSEQYGVIVVCKTSSHQEEVYNELLRQGFECRVVVT